MNSVELFKYVVAIIGAAVAVIVIIVVSGAIYNGSADATSGMEPEIAQAEAPPSALEAASAPKPAPEPAAAAAESAVEIADATERANLILHLRSLGNDPLPLPAE
jgi:hypothetical protein